MPPIVEQGVDRLLQHALFVSDDDIRRLELKQVLETVVPVDDATVKIVQIGGRKPATLERNERAEIRRNNRQNIEHHPVRTCMRALESLHELDPFGQFLTDLF